MNQPTLSTLSSPIVGKLKEQSGIGENRALLEKRPELSSEEPKIAVTRKLEGTKGGASRVEKATQIPVGVK